MKIIDLGAVALHLRDATCCFGVPTAAGSSCPDDLGGCRGRVVDLNDDVLEVVCSIQSVIRGS